MHLSTPNGRDTLCHHTGDQERTSDINLADCNTCLWALAKLLLVQLTGALGRLHVVERNRTVR